MSFYFRCVLNWFGDWSTGALYQVGKEFTSKLDLEKSNVSVWKIHGSDRRFLTSVNLADVLRSLNFQGKD